MNLQKSSLLSKWQNMLTIVNQNDSILQPNRRKFFKKISLLRLININMLVFFIQFSGLNLSTLSGSLPLWFATGTSCAYLFLRGYTIILGIWLGSVFAYYWAHAGLLLAIYSGTLLSLQALLLYWFTIYYLKPTLIFYKLKTFFQFILYTGVLTALISLSLLLISHSALVHSEGVVLLAFQWWLANFNAILIFSCAFITWDAYFPRSYSLQQGSVLFYALYFLLIMISLLLCISTSLIFISLEMLCSLLLVISISYLFAWPGSMMAVFLSGIILSLAIWLNAAINAFPMVYLQLFLGIQAIIGLSIAIRKGL